MGKAAMSKLVGFCTESSAKGDTCLCRIESRGVEVNAKLMELQSCNVGMRVLLYEIEYRRGFGTV